MTPKGQYEEYPLDAPPVQAVAVDEQAGFRRLLLQKEAALKNFLGSKENAMKFMSSVMNSVQSNPKLLECTGQSLLGAFMECAALALYPSNHSGDCYVLPYKEKGTLQAQFQVGYRGLKTLAYRSGILRCGTDIVFEQDEFREERGSVQKLVHIPAKGERGEAIGAYAWAEVNKDAVVFNYMSKAEIMKIKATSKAAGSEYSPWNSKNDPMKWMWQKTAFKQLAKMIPTSDKLDRAIYLDNVSERGGYIKGESEVVEVPFNDTFDEVQSKKAALREKKSVTPQDHE